MSLPTDHAALSALLDQRHAAEAALDVAWGQMAGALTEDPLIEEWAWSDRGVLTQSRADLVSGGERGGPTDAGQVYLYALGEVLPVPTELLTRSGITDLLSVYPASLPTSECVRCAAVGCVGMTAVVFTSTRLVVLTFCSTCNRQMFDLANTTGPWAWGYIEPTTRRGVFRCS